MPSISRKYRTKIHLLLGSLLLTLFVAAFQIPNKNLGVSVQMKLNKQEDTLFRSLEEFEKNDSLVFSLVEDASKYTLVNYELRLLARPKELYHNVVRSSILPKREIMRYYNNAESTVTVFFSDIRLTGKKDNHVYRAKPIKFKILKTKTK